MKDKRQGNDLKVAWSIFMQDGEPFRLEGKDVSLYLKNMFGRKELNDFVVTGNIIQWTFYGKDQKNSGKYSLELVINEGEKGMITTDKCDFVNLVSCSCKLQGGEDAPNVETESIELTSTLEYVAGGGSYDDTALWKELENKVDKVEGKGLSTNDYTDEDREKLSGLENYDDSEIKVDLAKKAEKSEIPTKMSQLEQDIEIGGTPDWSASEGEAGYIKNRTHYLDCDSYTPIDVESGDDYDTGYLRHTYRFVASPSSDETKVAVKIEIYNPTDGADDYIKYVILNTNDHISGEGEDIISFKVGFTEFYGTQDGNEITLWTLIGGSDEIPNLSFAYIYERQYKQLDEVFISSDIARKSDVEKVDFYLGEVGAQAAGALKEVEKHEEQLTELSAEVSGLSERIENLPTAESSVFEAVYGETTYDEIKEAFEANKVVYCYRETRIYMLTKLEAGAAYFAVTHGNYYYRLACYPGTPSTSWNTTSENFQHSLKSLDNGNAEITIAGKTAEVATPQYVENLLGTIINGDY